MKQDKSPLTVEIAPYDTADYLEDDADRAGYLEACIETGDTALVAHALGVIARSKGMTHMARETGISRDGLYKALSSTGNPEFSTVLKVMKALGLHLHVKAV
jgi:probable addiction module antidote protein